MRRYFNPRKFRVILFDQRGCGRSQPRASVTNNTTWHLIADIEGIRQSLGIDRWVVFGGSWGAALALIYAQACPDVVARLVLRGVFMMTRAELDWFYGGGAGRFWPETWERFVAPIPECERGDLITAYGRRLFCGDVATEIKYARVWLGWEDALASIRSFGHIGRNAGKHAHAFARIENHYFMNNGFLKRDGQILEDMPRIADIPGVIVQGRYDMICPPVTAWTLNQVWPGSELRLVRDAGHAMSEPAITAELVRATNRIGKDGI